MASRRRRRVLIAAATATAVTAGLTTVVVAHAAAAGCQVSYTVSAQWNTGFTANAASKYTNSGSDSSASERVSFW